jgi:hypothetical protein
MQLSVDQILEETSDWPEDAVADLVDRILRAKYGEIDPSVDEAWRVDIHRRFAELESGNVQGIPLDETLGESAQNHRPVKVVLLDDFETYRLINGKSFKLLIRRP